MKTKMILTFLSAALGLSGCASYNYAQNLKMVSFEENGVKGKSIGNIRGEDCTWTILGYQLGGAPTLDRAFRNVRNQAGTLESAGLDISDAKNRGGSPLRYVNNVSTANDGFNAGVMSKTCIVVTGVGYQ